MWETPPLPSELPETPPPASSPGPYTAQTADVTSCVEDRGGSVSHISLLVATRTTKDSAEDG